MPAVGALIVVRSRLSSACAQRGLASAARWASALARAGAGRRHLLRRGAAQSAASARACAAPARACTARCCGHAQSPVCAAATSDFGGVGGGAGRVGRGDRRVELLLRDFVLGEQRLEPLDVARGLGRGRLALAQPRLRRDELRLGRLDLAVGDGDAGLRLFDAAGAWRTSLRGRDLGDRHAGRRPRPRSLRRRRARRGARSTATW